MEDRQAAAESLEQVLARHRREQKELQARVTSKKKNATKKTRRGVNDECAALERELRERQAGEVEGLLPRGGGGDGQQPPQPQQQQGGGDGEEEGEREERLEAQGEAELTDGLRKVSFAVPPSEPDAGRVAAGAGAGGGGAGQQPKKRNRQKERLARRAAEAEAAAEAARTEAAGMVDRRGTERTALQAAFRAQGLEEMEMAPDGHCLFSAVADQLAHRGVAVRLRGGKTEGEGEEEEEGQREAPYRTVRRAAAEYMAHHGDAFAGFLDEEETLDQHVAKIRDTAEWGGMLELNALANAYGVEIRVVQHGRTDVISPEAHDAGKADGGIKTIWLAYYRHGYGLGEHYNSLRGAKQVAVGS